MMRTLCFAKEERKSEREREPARKNSIIRRVVNLKKGRHTKSQIFWFWTLEERDLIKNNHSFVPCTSRIA